MRWLQGVCNGADTGHNGYGDNLACGKTIQAPQGSQVELTFTHITLEGTAMCSEDQGCTCANPPCGDTLWVFDGPSESSPRLGAFTGTELPPAVQSTGNTMFIKFTTDAG